MLKFHLITEKHSKNIRLKLLSKNTAVLSPRISKRSREITWKYALKVVFSRFLLMWQYFRSVMPPFHQGLFSPIGPIWTRLFPINQSFNLSDGRPESPPIAQLFLTRLSPNYINESSRLFCQLGKAMYQKSVPGLIFALKFVLPEHSKMVLH